MLEQLAHSVIATVNQEILTKTLYTVENSPEKLTQLHEDDPRYLLALGALEALGYARITIDDNDYSPPTLTDKGSRVYRALQSDGAFTAYEEEAARAKQAQPQPTLFSPQQAAPPPAADSEIPF